MTTAGGLALAGCTLALIAAPVAGASNYRNDTPIAIPAEGSAHPYPSSITVSGTAGPITDVNVGLDGYTHPYPEHVGIVLVAPTGQALVLIDCVGDTAAAADVNVTLDDAATSKLPSTGPLSSGTFEPTAHCASSFPAPGPLTAYAHPGPGSGGTATFASTFNGSSAIGTWNLYVADFHLGGGGAGFIEGWSLDLHPDVAPFQPVIPKPTPKKKCKKKKRKKSAAAAKKKRCKKKKKKKT
jgi:subtilisin-like proprotein convertase family protein